MFIAQVPGEMFTLAMEAKKRGAGVVGSTQNILDFIAAKLAEALQRSFPERVKVKGGGNGFHAAAMHASICSLFCMWRQGLLCLPAFMSCCMVQARGCLQSREGFALLPQNRCVLFKGGVMQAGLTAVSLPFIFRNTSAQCEVAACLSKGIHNKGGLAHAHNKGLQALFPESAESKLS